MPWCQRVIIADGAGEVYSQARTRSEYASEDRRLVLPWRRPGYHLPAERVFTSWQELVKEPKLCDAVVIATMDQDHVEPALICTRMGYHMLLEKPMATSLQDYQSIAAAVGDAATVTSVCHSMRYHKAFATLKKHRGKRPAGRDRHDRSA